MRVLRALTFLLCLCAESALRAPPLLAQQPMQHPAGHTEAPADHSMLRAPLGGGWILAGMAQAFWAITIGAPFSDAGDPVHETAWYLTQPAVMANLESPGQRVTLRTTLNFEGVTQPDGELSYGGWGEGFLDKRHPHTLLHELMVSVNAWDVGGSALSLSAGRGFAPYGTDDPMSRPVLKYPTNHHLSQILERWALNAIWRTPAWSLEAGLFGGAEPTGPYDLSGLSTFGDSWSTRLTRRWGGAPSVPSWELSASFARVTESLEGADERIELLNGAVRREGPLGPGALYALAEASRSRPEGRDGHFSLLAEAAYQVGSHQPYVRTEYATRPEYVRDGPAGTDAFFRYGHHVEPVGATRWLITSVGYAYRATPDPGSVRPFVEIQHHRVRPERGGVDPGATLGSDSFWAASIGMRVFLGGGPMRMGRYGVLDAMTTMSRAMASGMAGMAGMGR